MMLGKGRKLQQKQTEKRPYLKELLVTQMNHWALFPVYLLGIALSQTILGEGKAHVWLWLLLGCVPFGLFEVRIRIRRFLLFLVIHIGIGAAMLFLLPAESVVIRVLYGFVAFGYIVNSMLLWTKTDDFQDIKLHPLMSTGLYLVLLIILNRLAFTAYNKVCAVALILVIGVYFIIYYMEQYQHFLVVNNDSAGHIPAAEMYRSGLGLVCTFAFLGVIVLFFTTNLAWMRGILNALRNGLYAVLRFVLQFFPRGGEDAEMVPPDIDNQMAANAMDGMDLSGESFWLWDVLENILGVVLAIALAVGIVYGSIRLVRWIAALMRRQPKAYVVDTSADAVRDVHEKIILSEKNKTTFSNPLKQLSPAARIRQMYRKKMLSAKDVILGDKDVTNLSHYTARECESILQAGAFAAIYEKARYTNEECTGEDVKRMREACK